MTERDPYQLDPQKVADPPTSWLGRVRLCGPGFILSASIVGSGELIATTSLGAKAGFATMWVILASCLVKVAIQLEFGRHTIQTGETCMAAFNRLPGPKLGRAHWSIWFWLILQPIKILQVGGIVGGLAILLNLVAADVSVAAWCWISAVGVALLVCYERYQFIERLSLILLGLFTLLTLISVAALQWTPYAVTWDNLALGLSGTLPPGALVFVFGAFGLTGVGGDEIMHYTYWLTEKGYAANTGPYQPEDPQWQRRARGWIQVMYLDAILSMIAYTTVTAAFFVLGAAVLHARGEVPAADEMVTTLSTMYTQTLGPWAKNLFLAGAFVVLFSTLFAALAAWTRTFADSFGEIGWIDFDNLRVRRRTMAVLAWFFPLAWATAYLWYQAPVTMILIGGLATYAILLVVVFAAIHFHYKRTLPGMKPGGLYHLAFLVSSASISLFAVFGVAKALAEALRLVD